MQDVATSSYILDDATVAVVLLVGNGVDWLRASLSSIAAQDAARIGIVAVDCGSVDGSRDVLIEALGPERVILSDKETSVSRAIGLALEREAVQGSDFLFVMHGDTALEPDAISKLVETARSIERVGVVGPKVVDWDDPTVLREVGLSSDRFGHLYSKLEPGEIDHHQYDRTSEVLAVSFSSMLISRGAWARTGLPDERLGSHEDLDYCWRVRLAGFRVLVAPLAVVRHKGASLRGEGGSGRGRRYGRLYKERAGLAATLKNYGIISELWIQPLYALQGLGKLIAFLLARRFEDAYQLVGAWGWNFLHLPGTIARRARAQSVRSVPDRAIRRFMAPEAERLRTWLEAGSRLVAGDLEVPEDQEVAALPFRTRASSAARGHPVAAAVAVAVALCIVAFRGLIGPGSISGGALPAFPSVPSSFFTELVSALRTTGLGGSQAASPSLGLVGGLSFLSLAHTQLAQKILLTVLPPLAGASMYRGLSRQIEDRVTRLVAAAAYALSPIMMLAFSEGRIATLVLLAVLPVLWDRTAAAFGARYPQHRWRYTIGTGAFFAVGLSFFSGSALAAALIVAVFLIFAERKGHRVGGLLLTFAWALTGAVLAFLVVIDLVQSRGAGLASQTGTTDFWSLVRLALGSGTGTWVAAFAIPIAAGLSLLVVRRADQGRALRFTVLALAGLALSWASSAGWLPSPVSNPTAYLAVTALGYCGLIALGVASIRGGLERHAFGSRQIAAGLLIVAVVGGLLLQTMVAIVGDWAVGKDKLPPAWPLVSSSPGAFNILWLGKPGGAPFPAPGGDPSAQLSAGDMSMRYSLTGREGAQALDLGRADYGLGYDYLRHVLLHLVSGSTVNAGAMLAPLGIRYVVAAAGDLPSGVRQALSDQVDLDLIPAGGLIIFRDSVWLPPGSVLRTGSISGSGPADAARLDPSSAVPLARSGNTWSGVAGGSGAVWLAQQFAPGFRMALGGSSVPGTRVLGWGTGFPVANAGRISIDFSRQWVRTIEVAVLALLWAIALWATRKPSR
jgi:GT2 family glycosyltransferase